VKDTETVADIGLRGFGTINVQVNFARRIAAPGALVTYNGINFRQADQDGRLSYSLPVGSYQFTASHPQDTLLLGKAGVTLAGNGDITPVAVTLGGAGSVRGTILRPGGSTPANGFPYTIKLLNGASTAVRSGRTDAVGQFQIFGVPLGVSRLTAFDPDADRFADAEVTLATDGSEAIVELVVEPDRIALPAALFDANRYRFDVQDNAALANGSNAFNGAAVLEVNGEVFTGATSAALEIGKRQFAVAQEGSMSGLKVTRKIFVPRGAYFARYLEVFENPGPAAITVRAGLRTGYRQAQLFGSSSGADLPGTADDWLVLDDQADVDSLQDGGQPASAHVHGQPDAGLHASRVVLDAGAGQSQQLLQQWDGLRVPAGAKVALLHFVVQQVNRNGARASAQRLVQLPPEALDGLTPAEAAAIVNFRVPLDNVSLVPALPSLTESLGGQVFEGDGVTTVNNVKVTVQSVHPLFNRVWGLVRNWYCEVPGTAVGTLSSSTVVNDDPALTRSGVYSIQGVLSDRDSIALPAGTAIRLVAQEPLPCFGDAAGHAVTRMPSRVVSLPGPVASQPLLFDSGILTGTVSGPPGLGVTTGRVWRSFDNPDAEVAPFYVPIAADGTYVLPGLVPGMYDMMADVPHPQGSKLRGERLASTVTLGRTTVTDIALQKVGTVRGTVMTANGEPSVNAQVSLASPAADQAYDACAGCAEAAPAGGKRAVARSTRTDTLGRYNFNAVPVGAYSMTATDPVSQAQRKLSLNVGDGQDAIHNVTLLTLGSVRLSVSNAAGAAAPDATVHVFADAEGVEKVAGRTAGGMLTIANIPFGNFRLRVVDPRFPDERRYDQLETGTISDSLPQDKAISLMAVASLRVTTHDGDAGNGNAILSNAAVKLGAVDRGMSNAAGALLLPALVAGQYELSATRELEGRIAAGRSVATIGVAEDNQVIDVPLALKRSFGSAVVTALDTDQGNAALPNARVFLKQGSGAKVEVGVTDATGSLLISGIAPGAYQITVAALIEGRTEQLVVGGTITALNIGQTQVHSAPFRRSLLLQRVLTFNEERHLYSVALQAGDRLSTSIKGMVVDGIAAAYQVRATVFDGAFNSPASGYGMGPEGNYRQGNYYGDLTAVTAARAGTYTIAVSVDVNAPRYLGGYELGVSVNGVPQAPQLYADSGSVTGTLLRSDGVTVVPNTAVRIAAEGGSGMQSAALTDAAGKYLFAGVPLGEFVLRTPSGNATGMAAGTLSVRGATVTTNLRLVAATTVNVIVKNVDGTPVVSGSVYYNNDGSTRFLNAGNGRTDEQGKLSFVVTGNTRIQVYASGSSSMARSAITAVEPNDNAAVALELTVASVSLSGQALTAAGTPFLQGQVQVRLASAGPTEANLWTQYVDSMGRFTIPALPAFQELLVQVRNYNAPAAAPGMTRVISVAGEPIADVIVRMPGKATLTSSVIFSTGRPVTDATARVSWFNTYDPSASIYGAADANGLIRMTDLPSDIPLSFVLEPSGTALTLTLKNGETRVLPAFVIEVGAVVKAMLRTADGESLPDYWCDFKVEAANYGQSGNGPCSAGFEFVNVPPGPATVQIAPQGRSAYGSVVVNAVDKVETTADLWLGTVRGTVRYQGGAAVPYPSVYLLDAAGEMSVPGSGTGEDGGYAIHGVRQGPFTLVAQDQNGLTGSVSGNLTDGKMALALDVTLPPSATVAGKVTDANGNPVADAAVYLQNLEQDLERIEFTDADGNYRIDRVGLGQVQVSAVGAGQGPATASAKLDQPGEVRTVNLRFPLPGSVSGKVVDADGVTPLSGASVRLTAAEASAAYGDVERITSTDSAGAFTFANAPVGLLRVDAVAADQSASATGTVPVLTGANAALILQAGAARALPWLLPSSQGYEYGINEDGSIDAYQDGYARIRGYYNLAVSGMPFAGNALATLMQGGSEVQLGPRNHAGLSVVRRLYVPAARAYVRMFDSLTNTTGADMDTVVRIASPAMRGPDGPMQIGLLDAGPGYAIYSAPDYGVNRDTSVMTVFNGTAGARAPALRQFNLADGSFMYAWTLRVPAGKTVSLLHFTSLTVGAPLATAQAQALAAGNDPAMFNGLSAADKASIHNFTVTQ
jgi:protocatechuate 3,4-dioxygenase beta subunit